MGIVEKMRLDGKKGFITGAARGIGKCTAYAFAEAGADIAVVDLAASIDTPVVVMETASEGGAWGIALLAAYLADGKSCGRLEDYLNERVFKDIVGDAMEPDPAEVAGFETFIERYSSALDAERVAIESVKW